MALTNRGEIQGTWGYNAGTNATLILSGNKQVLQITVVALGQSATFTINGGDTITLPYNSPDKASTALTIEPKGNLIDPTLVFSAGVAAYFVEWVLGAT